MARRNKDTRYSIFDVMDAKGVFDDNPANQQADAERDGVKFSTWPNAFPKMMYHPMAEMKVTRLAEVIVTPMGPKFVNERKEMISAIVTNESEERALRAKGWHDHPAKAIAAAGGNAPPISAAARIDDLEAEIARLRAEKDQLASRELNPKDLSSTSAPLTAAKALASSEPKKGEVSA
jgi:hypothetical protein